MKEMLFILNPKAGTKKANKALVDILNIFNRADYRVQVYITAGAKDAISAVKQFAPGKDLVVCCGGDGTFNETVTGMLDAGLDLPIGYIPAGSTNDFANSIGLPSSLTAAAEQIVNGAPMRLDVGRLGEQYFCYVTSFGAFTRASYNTSQNAKNTLGHAAYLLEGLSELPQIRKKNMRFELDGEVLEDDYVFGAVCNSTSLGGILTIDPKQVDMSDGMFEVMLIRAPKDLSELTECLIALQKQQYNCRMITFRSVQDVKVTTSSEMYWTIDGEKGPNNTEIHITNLHHAIQLIK